MSYCPRCEARAYENPACSSLCSSYANQSDEDLGYSWGNLQDDDLERPRRRRTSADLTELERLMSKLDRAGLSYRQLRNAVARLSSLQRRILYLRLWENCSVIEIASDVRLRVTEVFSQLNQAYAWLGPFLPASHSATKEDSKLALAAA